MDGSWSQRAPLFGVLGIVLIIVAVIVGGSTPDPSDSAQKVSSFYTDNDSKEILSNLIAFYGVAALAVFIAVLRSITRRVEGGTGTLSALSFGGGVLLVMGLLVFAGITFALADQADHLDPSAAQALNALSGDWFFPAALGLILWLIPAGIVLRRAKNFPGWLAWVAIVLGVVALTPLGFFALVLSMLWVIVAGIMLTVKPAT